MKDKRIVTDPEGVLVRGRRYPRGTRVADIGGAIPEQLKAWAAHGRIGEPQAAPVSAPAAEEAKPEEVAAPVTPIETSTETAETLEIN